MKIWQVKYMDSIEGRSVAGVDYFADKEMAYDMAARNTLYGQPNASVTEICVIEKDANDED